MARKKVTTLAYSAIRIEGGLIPADELTRLTTLTDPALTEQAETQYRIPKGLKLRDEIGRDFKIALSLWADFSALRKRSDVNAYEVTVREFLLPLMRDVLHFSDIERYPAIEKSGHSYAIGYAAEGGQVPIVFAAYDQSLDAPAERFGETNPDTGKVRRRSPYLLAQEALNASDAALWAIVTNGLTLRILRDNPSLTRPAYVEVDLEELCTEELLPDFTAFWLLAHASRFGSPPGEPTNCVWERWRAAGQEAGATVRTNLRYQVADALRALGTGFLSHPANGELRAALQRLDSEDGALTRQAFFEELLRLVYRLIFLSTIEDRVDKTNGHRLIFTPDASAQVQQRYLSGYSMTWLRERAVRRSEQDRHSDLWHALTITFGALAKGEPHLGLPALGGLFDTDQCPWLDGAQLENRWLLAAVFQLGWFRANGGLTRVNYRDMGPEELGSVYESLLELDPQPTMLLHPASARLTFTGDEETDATNRGNARKLTGSYYTPDSLVQELIKTALEPVIAETVRANPGRPVEALLNLTICDPACGSGHFLLSAARRLADEVAVHRAATEREGGAPTPVDFRHALRDVVSHCIFGVDKNPMAIQLAKTALWLEAYSPDRPLSFVDHHLQVGDALLGVLDPKVLEHGIPDEAYTALSADDKAVATALKKQNKADLKSWKSIASGDLFTQAGLAARGVAVEMLSDDTPESVAAKRAAWREAQAVAQRSMLARLADTYVAAFLAPKLANTGERVPLSGYLWGVLSGEALNADVEETAEHLCQMHSVFHWWLAFPQVASKGGFSVMLGNPPWERIKLQEEEFFASRSPLVATAKNKAERSQRIEWLREGVLLHNLNPDQERAEGLTPPNKAEMALYEAFIDARRGAEAASLFAHDGRRYPLTGVGDVNTYALFAETFLQATSPHGRAGFIVPTGIATDDSTKAYFGHIASSGKLTSLYDFENSEAVFPAVHRSYKFSLLTLGAAHQAEFVCFATQVPQVKDPRRRFQLTSSEIALINPNTRTCPIFRSERDAELTKKLYRAASVLIREAQFSHEGELLEAEANPWGIRFQSMLHMSNDSGLFFDQPGSEASTADAPRCLPLYEAKMIHQFDHRWATYVDAPDRPGGVDTAVVSVTEKADPTYAVRPRYWVPEREVLARIARVPSRVARAWLQWHVAAAPGAAQDSALAELLLALAAWVAGELFARAAGEPEVAKQTGQSYWPQQRALPYIAPVEAQLKARFGSLSKALLGTGLTTKKALAEFPKWATQNHDIRLSDAELNALDDALKQPSLVSALLNLLDTWMDQRSPQWLMGWRDICRNTDVRTLIAGATPRTAMVGDFPCINVGPQVGKAYAAALLANLNALPLDYVARQKVSGAHLKFFHMRQLPILRPDCYNPTDSRFIISRVLELTYTAYDLRPWADDLAAYDSRPAAERNRPFAWNPERRAQLRAELDAYYARLYDLTRDELRYILDPADVMGSDYPSETFRVLKNSEMREFGEYRTQRLVLSAWDSLERGEAH
ncbi:Eco57I restriction-modification methylase domain-containing protein [Paraburkholderia hospita]|uniref:site-specific DNA-methyltransferase (adenine-specific) n=1 Tax=Paraburkholderia hospita TaxID=169430 RepID=A0AAN1J9S3_9BURK|nr:N-6 DNA methylase [Paraburkholderia hospita]AUT70040.1 restriction endonuclease [Paraburkholderia hospita]